MKQSPRESSGAPQYLWSPGAGRGATIQSVIPERWGLPGRNSHGVVQSQILCQRARPPALGDHAPQLHPTSYTSWRLSSEGLGVCRTQAPRPAFIRPCLEALHQPIRALGFAVWGVCAFSW